MLSRYGLAYGLAHLNQGGALVHIYTDGSILVGHGGTEMGQVCGYSHGIRVGILTSLIVIQGLYTKMVQVAAQELKVPLDTVFTSESSTSTVPNTS